MGGSGTPRRDPESGALEDLEEACVRSTGAVCWVVLGLVGFSILVSQVPVSGVTDAPRYARTLLYLSLGWHYDDVYAVAASPPPPSF